MSRVKAASRDLATFRDGGVAKLHHKITERAVHLLSLQIASLIV
jgi:hypothetical protein